MTRELVETPRFARALRRFARRNPQRQQCVAEALLQMGRDVFHPALKTHALSGTLAGLWACSCGYDCRIVFSIVRNPRTKREYILLLDVGTHEAVY